MNDFIEQQTQQRIVDLLKRKPGLYISKIAELLNIHIVEVERHLALLEEKEIILSKIEDGLRRYYCQYIKMGISDTHVIETRRKIYDLIAKNPGLHQTKIAQMLGMSKSHAEYHLNCLERSNVIQAVVEPGFKRYYVEDIDLGLDEKELLAFLHTDVPKNILVLLLRNPNLKHKDILAKFEIAPSTLSYHLTKLVKKGILSVVRYGEEKGYRIINKRQVLKLLVSYEFEGAVDGIKDLWNEFV